jgi:hypothetical protein
MVSSSPEKVGGDAFRERKSLQNCAMLVCVALLCFVMHLTTYDELLSFCRRKFALSVSLAPGSPLIYHRHSQRTMSYLKKNEQIPFNMAHANHLYQFSKQFYCRSPLSSGGRGHRRTPSPPRSINTSISTVAWTSDQHVAEAS